MKGFTRILIDSMMSDLNKGIDTLNKIKHVESIVKKAPEKKFSEPKGSNRDDRTYGSPEVFATLSALSKSRGIDYRTLKNNIGTRVIEVDSGYVLAEDIVSLYKEQIKKTND